jgi:hypothetical protein
MNHHKYRIGSAHSPAYRIKTRHTIQLSEGRAPGHGLRGHDSCEGEHLSRAGVSRCPLSRHGAGFASGQVADGPPPLAAEVPQSAVVSVTLVNAGRHNEYPVQLLVVNCILNIGGASGVSQE